MGSRRRTGCDRGVAVGRETIWLAARAFSRLAPTSELIDWATSRLEEGADGPATLELAILDRVTARHDDALPLLRRALAEQGLEIEDQAEALKVRFRDLMAAIVEGKLRPEEGVDRVWEEIIAVGLYRAPFAGIWQWYGDELREWDDFSARLCFEDHSELPDEGLRAEIRVAAARALERGGGT